MVFLLSGAAESGNIASHDLAGAAGKGMTCLAAGNSSVFEVEPWLIGWLPADLLAGAFGAAGALGARLKRARPCCHSQRAQRDQGADPCACSMLDVLITPASLSVP